MAAEPGWYHAEGDPPGTQRFWNGGQWVGDPIASQPPTGAATADTGWHDPPASGGELASPGRRIAARAIDLLILIVVSIVIIWPIITDIADALDALPSNASQEETQAVIEDVIEDAPAGRLLGAALFTFLYDFLMVGFLGGTVGKLLLGLRVANADSMRTPPSLDRAGRRALNRLIGLLGGVLGGGVSALVILLSLASFVLLFADGRHRTVMDFIGQTVVVKK